MSFGAALASLMADTRLSEAARVIGFWLLHQEGDEDGFVEVRFDDIRGMLHGFPSDDVIRKHLRMLRGSAWAERKSGGRGRSDRYRMIDPALSPPYMGDRPESQHTLSDKVGPDPSLKLDSPASAPSLKPSEGGDKGGGACEIDRELVSPPVVPPTANAVGEVDPEAEELIGKHPEALMGCRGALRDYLARRVPSGQGRQRGFVATVVTWVEGGWSDRMWSRVDGTKVKPPERPAVLAEALNELLGSNETERAHEVGDPRNLKNKITGLIRDDSRRSKPSVHRPPSRVKTKSRMAANQGEFIIEGDDNAA